MSYGPHESVSKPYNMPMSENDLSVALGVALAAEGFHHRLAPIRIVEELHRELRGLREKGLLAESLFAEYADDLEFSSPSEVPAPRTLIVVASPSPAVKVLFHMDTGPLEAVIPPQYIHSVARTRCLEILRSVLSPSGHTVTGAQVPVKLLAVRTGLARYVRSNLAYVQGMGTLIRLDAFCTDADLQAEEYKIRGSLIMSSCPPCRNCHNVCPTGCIPYNGTVINAQRCLTYFNEREGEWPDWLDPKAHNSLVGCMRCQAMCPADRYHLRREKVVAEFDRKETEIILENLPSDQLPDSLRAKLQKLDLERYSTVLGRNLRALRDASA